MYTHAKSNNIYENVINRWVKIIVLENKEYTGVNNLKT